MTLTLTPSLIPTPVLELTNNSLASIMNLPKKGIDVLNLEKTSSETASTAETAALPIIRETAATALIDATAEKAKSSEIVILETPAARAEKILDDLLQVNMQCSQPVVLQRSCKSLMNLFSGAPHEVRIDFDKHSAKEQGYKLTGITSYRSLFFADTIEARAEFTPNTGAKFWMSYNNKKQEVEVDLMYRGDLPVWIKEGNERCWFSEKGVPTAKAMNALLMNQLGLTKDNVKTIVTTSMNPQTVVDVVYDLIVNKKSVTEAYALCQTSQINAELCQNLEAEGLTLTGIESSGAYSFVEALLYSSDWSESQKIAFRKQPKILKIKELTGIDIIRDPVKVPDAVVLTYSVKK